MSVEPERPHESGVPEKSPDLAQIEAARQLATDARPALAGRGFSDHEIEEWAKTFIADEGSGDVGDFVAWIRRRQETG